MAREGDLRTQIRSRSHEWIRTSGLKRRLHDLGVLRAYHRLRNRHHLTVVMFHRVLPEADPRWADADAAWTVSDTLFQECLEFFRAHYNVVGMEDLLRAADRGARLPERALLITFDDGWADTEEYGAAHLARAGLPAALFVVAEGVGEAELWQESLLRAWRRGELRSDDWTRLWEAVESNPLVRPAFWKERAAVDALILRLCTLNRWHRAKLLEPVRRALGRPPRAQMISPAQLRMMRSRRIAVGSHGLTHTPIPQAGDAMFELQSSRSMLAELMELPPDEAPETLSFPHGAYDSRTVAIARAAGYKLLFTSDPYLNAWQPGQPLSGRLGRIHIPAEQISDTAGRLAPERLACWLFLRRPMPPQFYAAPARKN
jgi:peptidoglycan/xylan/chitin deacetylase (PgdA/CDA1 family)